MRIALFSLYACGNVGDEAINRCVFKQLQSQFPKAGFYSFSLSPVGFYFTRLWNPFTKDSDPDPIRKIFLSKANSRKHNWSFFLLRLGFIKIIWKLMHIDVLVWAGGYWLHDLNLLVCTTIMGLALLAKILNKKVIFYAVGAGPLKSRWGKFLTSLSLNRVDLISVRDQQSQLVLYRAGIKKRVWVTADPALKLPIISSSRAVQLLKTNKIPCNTPILGISICAWYRMSEYYCQRQANIEKMKSAWSELVENILQQRKVNIIFIPTMLPEDRDICEGIRQKIIANKNRVFVLQGNYTSLEIQAIIGYCKGLISMRLHPLIFAINMKTPVLALNYDAKVQNFMKMIRQTDYCLPVDILFTTKFIDQALHLIDLKYQYSISRQSIINTIRQRAEITSSLCARILQKTKT